MDVTTAPVVQKRNAMTVVNPNNAVVADGAMSGKGDVACDRWLCLDRSKCLRSEDEPQIAASSAVVDHPKTASDVAQPGLSRALMVGTLKLRRHFGQFIVEDVNSASLNCILLLSRTDFGSPLIGAPQRLSIDESFSLSLEAFEFTDATRAHQVAVTVERVSSAWETTTRFVAGLLATKHVSGWSDRSLISAPLVGCYVSRLSSTVFHVGVVAPDSRATMPFEGSNGITTVQQWLAILSQSTVIPGTVAADIALPLCKGIREGIHLTTWWEPSEQRVVPLVPLPPFRVRLSVNLDVMQHFSDGPFSHVIIRQVRPAEHALLGATRQRINIAANRRNLNASPDREEATQYSLAFEQVFVAFPGEYLIAVELPVMQARFRPFVGALATSHAPFLAVDGLQPGPL